MKECKLCKTSLPLSDYHKDSDKPDGYRYECKTCRKSISASYYETNKERKKAYGRKYYSENSEKVIRSVKIRKNKHPSKIVKSNKNWYLNNKDKVLKVRKKYYDHNTDKVKGQHRKWSQANKYKLRSYGMKRNALKIKATPKWLTKEHYEQIKTFYKKAMEMTISTGIPHEVDHIVPLRGLSVRGLHVPWNLQVLTKSENSSKSNRLLRMDEV